MTVALAYFLTWSTYGHRVHGDSRGSIDFRHNQPRTPLLPPDPGRERAMRARMKDPPFELNTDMRSVVDQVVREHATIRRWDVHAINVRPTHVHVVVNCKGTHTPELAMKQFKEWGTRRLVEGGYATKGRLLWADHGSTQYLNDSDSLMCAIDYVLNRQ